MVVAAAIVTLSGLRCPGFRGVAGGLQGWFFEHSKNAAGDGYPLEGDEYPFSF